MKFFDLEIDAYLAKQVIVWSNPHGTCTYKVTNGGCEGSYIKGPLDQSCSSDATIWRKGVGHCKPDDK